MKKSVRTIRFFQNKSVVAITLIALSAALLLSIIFAVNLGTMDISVKEIGGVVLYKTLGIGEPEIYGSGPVADIIWYVRLPRIILAIAVGMGLSISGVVM